jgi:hypothetical protein
MKEVLPREVKHSRLVASAKTLVLQGFQATPGAQTLVLQGFQA